MKIADIKGMKNGVSGLDVEGTLKWIGKVETKPGREPGTTFDVQNVMLADGDEKIYVSMTKAQIGEDMKGTRVVIDRCKVNKYMSKKTKQEETSLSSSGSFNLGGEAMPKEATTTEKPEPSDNKKPNEEREMWADKAWKEKRSITWQSAFKTMFPILYEKMPSLQEICDRTDYVAKRGIDFTYEMTPMEAHEHTRRFGEPPDQDKNKENFKKTVERIAEKVGGKVVEEEGIPF